MFSHTFRRYIFDLFQRLEDIKRYSEKFQPHQMYQLQRALTQTCHLSKDVTERISDALENKYDILKDKLFREALKEQVQAQ